MHTYHVLGPLLGGGRTEMNEIQTLISKILMSGGTVCDEVSKSDINKNIPETTTKETCIGVGGRRDYFGVIMEG